MRAGPSLGALALLLPFVAWAGAAAPTPPFEGEVTGDRVYIRAGDGISYSILTVAARGERVSVTGERFGWFAVRVPKNCTVWVHRSLLAVGEDKQRAAVAKDRVNIRARPSRKGDVLGQLPQGATVALRDEDGEWVGIAPPAQARAWIFAKYVRKAEKPLEPPKVTPTDGTDAAQGIELLRKAREAYLAELAKPPADRRFGDVLAAYQKVGAECRDEAVARRAEQARQRLLKIVDLHRSLRALREPLEQFQKKYDALEKEYERRARPPAGDERK